MYERFLSGESVPMKGLVEFQRLSGVVATLVATMILLVPGLASGFERRVFVDGWSGDARRVIYAVEVRGATDQAEPYRYRLRQIVDAASGEVLGTYRVGEAVGPIQPAWEAAGLEASAENVLTGLRVRREPPSPIAPGLHHAVVLWTTTDVQRETSAECPGCRVCTTRWTLYAMDGDAGVAGTLDSGSLRGELSREPSCAEVRADAWWNGPGDSVLVVRSERTAQRVDTSRVYRLDAMYDRRDVRRPARVFSPSEAIARYAAAESELATRPDRGAALLALGVRALEAGRPGDAREWFARAEAVGVRAEGAAGRTVADALRGDRAALRDLARLARGGRGVDGLPVAVALRVLGDQASAARAPGGLDSAEAVGLLSRYHLRETISVLEGLHAEERSPYPRSVLMDLWLEAGEVAEAATYAPTADAPAGDELDQILWLGGHARRDEDVWATGAPLVAEGLHRCRFLAALALAGSAAEQRAAARSLAALAVACDPDDAGSLLLLARAALLEQRAALAVRAYERFVALTSERLDDRAGADRRDEARTIVDQAERTGVVVANYRCVTTPRVRCTGSVATVASDDVTGARVVGLAFAGDGEWLGEVVSEPVSLAPGGTAEFSFESESLGGAALFELRTEARGTRSERGLMVTGFPAFP
jgi:hypothetical protein